MGGGRLKISEIAWRHLLSTPYLFAPDSSFKGESLCRFLDTLKLSLESGFAISPKGKVSTKKIGWLRQASLLTGLGKTIVTYSIGNSVLFNAWSYYIIIYTLLSSNGIKTFLSLHWGLAIHLSVLIILYYTLGSRYPNSDSEAFRYPNKVEGLGIRTKQGHIQTF